MGRTKIARLKRYFLQHHSTIAITPISIYTYTRISLQPACPSFFLLSLSYSRQISISPHTTASDTNKHHSSLSTFLAIYNHQLITQLHQPTKYTTTPNLQAVNHAGRSITRVGRGCPARRGASSGLKPPPSILLSIELQRLRYGCDICWRAGGRVIANKYG